MPRKREGTPTITMKKGNMTLDNCFNSITYDQLSVLMIISPTTISLFYTTSETLIVKQKKKLFK